MQERFSSKLKSLVSDGRILIVIALIWFFSWVIFGLVNYQKDLQRELNVPTGYPITFLDLRSLTSAWDCKNKSIDVYEGNPCDVHGRPFNYPRVLLFPRYLGLGERHTNILGITLVVAFLLSFLMLLIEKISYKQAFLYILALISPVTLLAIERGNIDMIVFALLALAVYLIRKHKDSWGYVLIFVATVIKIFPIFAFGAAVKYFKKKKYIAPIVFAVLSVLYFIITYKDLVRLNNNTPKDTDTSYGSKVIFMIYKDIVSGLTFLPEIVRNNLYLVAIALAGLIALIIYFVNKKNDLYISEQYQIDAFRIGSLIYLGTFFLGNNFDYRLIFLIFCLPQLVLWAKAKTLGSLPFMTLGLVILLLWSNVLLSLGTDIVVLGRNLLPWIVFICLTALLLLSLPKDLKKLIHL
jgi:hypothetical protein